MPDLNLDLNFRDHPKTRRFVAMLGKDSDWLVVKLWLYVGRIHPDGRLKGYTGQEIESIAEWGGTPGAFIEAMERVGWLKKDENSGKNHYQLLGWKEHQGHLIAFKKRGKIAAKARWANRNGKHAKGIQQALLDVAPSNAPTDGTDVAKLTDGDWRAQLQASDAYRHLSVESEFQKMVFWCQQRRQTPTRRRFLNWLNRSDRPMKTAANEADHSKGF